MDKNQNTWSHRTKIIFCEIKVIFHPFRSLRGFPARFIVLWQENIRGTQKASLAGDHYNLLWMWFLNVWGNVPMDLKHVCQQYFTCMRFLGFIRYNKTFIACGFRKYENVFTHEYHIPLRRCPLVNKFSYFPHQHAINVYYYIMILFKQFYWLSCCHLTFRKIWYCLIKTRIDLVSLAFSNEIYKKNHMNSISIWPMDIKVMWNFVQSKSSY